MSPQLTLQTPIQLPPSEIPSYLEQLWSKDQPSNSGANTFSLLIWQPSWLEQKLIRTGRLKSPIEGNQRNELIEAARKVVLEKDLPHSTPPLESIVCNSLIPQNENKSITDLRGQHVHRAISALQPRRLITLAPTLNGKNKLETLVAAYCPLLEESGSDSACGDVVVFRGGMDSIKEGLDIVENLIPEELPSWIWWNGYLDEAKPMLNKLASSGRRLILDSALGDPYYCLELLKSKTCKDQAINDLNWLRLRSWRESLAMVFDPPKRREILQNIVNIDIDFEGENPVQGLLLAGWIADRLNWKIVESIPSDEEIIEAKFKRDDDYIVHLKLISLPVGRPSIHPGQIVGIRLICKSNERSNNDVCVILGAESTECMRLEAGGMASMELIEEVVPNQFTSVEMDVARLLKSCRGSTSPLLSKAAPLAYELFKLVKK